MSRTVKAWNPAWIAADCPQHHEMPAFLSIVIPDDHEHSADDLTECSDCGAFLCELCGSDQHSTSEGHDLSNPRYWGV